MTRKSHDVGPGNCTLHTLRNNMQARILPPSVTVIVSASAASNAMAGVSAA